jgi:hypothetical protein
MAEQVEVEDGSLFGQSSHSESLAAEHRVN